MYGLFGRDDMAWFSASVHIQPQTITAANYEIAAVVTDESGTMVASGQALQAGQSYRVTLTATGTADEFGGYCIVEGGGSPSYTAQLLPDETLQFTLIPDTTAVYTFTAVWGRYSGEADITTDGGRYTC